MNECIWFHTGIYVLCLCLSELILGVFLVSELMKTFFKNADIHVSWKHIGSKLQSAKIQNYKVDILSSYVVNASIAKPSKYMNLKLRLTS